MANRHIRIIETGQSQHIQFSRSVVEVPQVGEFEKLKDRVGVELLPTQEANKYEVRPPLRGEVLRMFASKVIEIAHYSQKVGANEVCIWHHQDGLDPELIA